MRGTLANIIEQTTQKKYNMKKTYLILICFLASTTGFSQSINFQLDTTQIFQDADVGAMALADVDNDGDNDVLITGKGGPVLTSLFLNDGSGNFSAVSNAPFQNVFGGDVKFLDVDNDNDLDVFITGKTSGGSLSSNLYTNNGSGVFSLATGSNFQPMEGGKNDVGDVDGDGDIDIVVTGQIASGIPLTKIYLNNGSGVFTSQANSTFVNLKFGAARFFDIENDGDLDLINCGENVSGQAITALYANNGNGVFISNNSSAIDNLKDSDIAVGDIDGDGDKDFIICGSTNSAALITTNLYLNNGLGVFSVHVGTPFLGVIAGTVKLADLDNDSDLDVFEIGASGSGVICKIHANLGSNNFIGVNSPNGAYLASAAIGDINGDQKDDIIYSGTQFATPPSYATRLYLNTSTILGLNEIDSPLFSIYPNPSSGLINLKTNNNMELEISIFNNLGSLLQKENLIADQITFHLQYPDGIYFLNVKSKDISETYKIVLSSK